MTESLRRVRTSFLIGELCRRDMNGESVDDVIAQLLTLHSDNLVHLEKETAGNILRLLKALDEVMDRSIRDDNWIVELWGGNPNLLKDTLKRMKL